MGDAADPMAVVDRETRVIGLEACGWPTARSCRPSPPGNLNAPTIMLAEKGRRPHPRPAPNAPLPASNAPFYEASNWQIGTALTPAASRFSD